MTDVIMMRGIPASGKSSMAAKLSTSKELPIPIIAKDNIRRAMYPNWKYEDVDRYIIEDVRDIAIHQHLAVGQDVIVDETFVEIDDMNRLLEQLPDDVGVYILSLAEVPFELCQLRNVVCGKRHPPSVMVDFHERLIENNRRFPQDLVREVIMMTFDEERWYREFQARLDHYEGIPLSSWT